MEILAHWTHGMKNQGKNNVIIYEQQNHVIYKDNNRIHLNSFTSNKPEKAIGVEQTPIDHFIEDHTYEDREFDTIDVFISPKFGGEIIKRKL